MTNEDTIKALKAEVATALAAGDSDASQKIMAVVTAFGGAMVECGQRRAFADGEKLLTDWRCFLAENERHLRPNQRLLTWGRFNSSAAYYWELRAQFSYYMEQDYIASPVFYERAEALHTESLKFLEKVEFDPNAPAEFLKQRQQTLDNERADALIARGMMLLTQGEFEVEIGALARGQVLLTQAMEALRTGESTADRSTDTIGEAGNTSSLSFVDYAESILCRAQSDQALLEGDLQAAAEGQQKRAEALERCRMMHSRFGNAVNEYFARRMARDAHVARQRQDRFKAAAAVQPRFGWLKSLIFLVAATIVPGLIIHWAGTAAAESTVGLGALLLYALVIAGIGSRLTTWREGTDVLVDHLSKLSKGGKDG